MAHTLSMCVCVNLVGWTLNFSWIKVYRCSASQNRKTSHQMNCNLILMLTFSDLCNSTQSLIHFFSPFFFCALRHTNEQVVCLCDGNRIWRLIFAIFIEQYFYVYTDKLDFLDRLLSTLYTLGIFSPFILHSFTHFHLYLRFKNETHNSFARFIAF